MNSKNIVFLISTAIAIYLAVHLRSGKNLDRPVDSKTETDIRETQPEAHASNSPSPELPKTALNEKGSSRSDIAKPEATAPEPNSNVDTGKKSISTFHYSETFKRLPSERYLVTSVEKLSERKRLDPEDLIIREANRQRIRLFDIKPGSTLHFSDDELGEKFLRKISGDEKSAYIFARGELIPPNSLNSLPPGLPICILKIDREKLRTRSEFWLIRRVTKIEEAAETPGFKGTSITFEDNESSPSPVLGFVCLLKNAGPQDEAWKRIEFLHLLATVALNGRLRP